MNTFKTIVVVGTLLSVGYGAHVVMNKPISNRPIDIEDQVWDDLLAEKPEVDLIPQVSTTLIPDLPSLESRQQASTTSTSALPNAGFNPPPVPASTELPSAEVDPHQAPLAVMPPPGQLVPVPADQSNLAADSHVSAPGVDPTSPVQAASSASPYPASDPTAAAPADQPWESQYEYSSTWSNGFEEMWDSVQLKLQSSQFVDALLAVSLFYSDEGLTGEQRNRMIMLLDQLAGTVIYSPDYHMEPAYVVQPGDSMRSIAASYEVPESLLARINGVTDGDLQPGRQLKVLYGPFRGELDVENRQLTIFLKRYYAGRFSVGVGRDLPAQVATLEVAELTGAKAFVDRRTGQEIAAGMPENPYGAYWIGLRDQSITDYPFLGIHATGESVDASDTRGCVSVSDQDANDLQAILSVGSTITLVR